MKVKSSKPQKGRAAKKRLKRILNATIDGIERNRAAAVMGRPGEYKPEFKQQAFEFALLGLKNAELAHHFAVSEATFTVWLRDHPDFLASIEDGRDKADGRVANSMYHRAMGYEHKELYISQYKGELITKEIIKRYPPDTAAASLWLRNRHPDRWRDRIEYTPAPPGEAARLLREQLAAMDAATSEEKEKKP